MLASHQGLQSEISDNRTYILPFGDCDTSPLPWLFICNRLSKYLLTFEGSRWSLDETRFSTTTLKVFGARCWKELKLRNPLNKQTYKHTPPQVDFRVIENAWPHPFPQISLSLLTPTHNPRRQEIPIQTPQKYLVIQLVIQLFYRA